MQEAAEAGKGTYTAVSAHLSNTTAKRRDVAKQLLGQLGKVAEKNDADIIAGDFGWLELHRRNMGTHASDSSSGLGSNVGPDGGIVRLLRLHGSNRSEQSWRVARHGSFQLDRDKMQMKETDRAAHLLVNIHFCEAQAAERSTRSEAAKHYRRKRGIEDAVKEERGRGKTIMPDLLHTVRNAPRKKKTSTCTRLSPHEVRGPILLQHVRRVRRVVTRCSPERGGKETAMHHR